MNISPTIIREYQGLYRLYFDEEISEKEAANEIQYLANLIRLVQEYQDLIDEAPESDLAYDTHVPIHPSSQ